MSKPDADVQFLGAYVHGFLTAFHSLGIVYNLRRRNYLDVLFHSGWLVYDAISTQQKSSGASMSADVLIVWVTWQMVAAILHSASLILTILVLTIFGVWIRRLHLGYNDLQRRLSHLEGTDKDT